MPEDPAGARDPWWMRALQPLRSEAAAFHLLVVVAAVCGTIIVLSLVLRAIF